MSPEREKGQQRMTNWRKALEQSEDRFIVATNEAGETVGIINQSNYDSTYLITGDKDIPAQHDAGVDRVLEELDIPKVGWR